MRATIQPFRIPYPRLLLTCIIICAGALLAAFPNKGDQKNQRFKIEPEYFLRAPDSIDAASFAYLTGIQFDNKGNLYLSDSKQMRTLTFAEDGTFLSSIPWEKGVPDTEGKTMFIMGSSPSGLLYAIEPVVAKRMVAYNDRGAVEKTSAYDQKEFSIWEYVFVDDRTVAASIKELTLYPQRRLKTRHSIALITLNDWWRVTVKEADRRDGGDFTNDFTNIVANKAGQFFFGLASQKEYVVYMHNRKGELLRTITKGYTPVRMRGAKHDAFLNQLKGRKLVADKMKMNPTTFSDTEPFFQAINWLAIDSDENLWVFTSEGENDNMLSVDLYDPKGDFKKTFELENKELGGQRLTHVRIRNNHLYSIIGDEKEQNQHICRYALPKEIWQ